MFSTGPRAIQMHRVTCIYIYCISRRQHQRFLDILFWGCLSGAVGSVGVWCSAVAEVVGSNLAKYLQHLSAQYPSVMAL